jgi:hypothetical protein
MSELRVAVVAEGKTDAIVIEAALKALLGARPFIWTLLQPEETRPKLGAGWCGVFKWCREVAARGFPSLEEDPTLTGFDLFVIHLDADVAGAKYADGGAAVLEISDGLPELPCEAPCPPADASTTPLRTRLIRWLGSNDDVGPRTVLCLPSKAIESWLAAAILPEMHELLPGLECRPNLAAQLAQLPMHQRIKEKNVRDFRANASAITEGWERVVVTCTQAHRFAIEAHTALALTTAPVTPASGPSADR